MRTHLPALICIILTVLLLAPALNAADHAGKASAAPKSRHVPKVAKYPEARCELVRQSVLADLPHFCTSDKSDKVRLIDFGNQVDLLEKRCGQSELAEKLRQALNERVHRKNKAGCTTTAEEMVKIIPSKARASVSESGF